MEAMTKEREEREAYRKEVLHILAFLLSYPDENWLGAFGDVRQAAESLKETEEKKTILGFFDYIAETGQKEYEELYVRTFEFSENTNLYLSSHQRTDFGKQAEELHTYKVLYLENGFDTAGETPDFLPALLELAAAIDGAAAERVLAAIETKVRLLRDRFIEAELPFAYLMDVILIQKERLEEDV